MKMAELSLLPAVRSADADTLMLQTAPVAGIRLPMACVLQAGGRRCT